VNHHAASGWVAPSFLLVSQSFQPENSHVPRGALPVSQRVKVEIYDQPYTISGELEPEYVTELARIVDERMREIARASGTVDSVRVAVLAALAIADELESLRQEHTRRDASVRERAERCLTLVERALRQSA